MCANDTLQSAHHRLVHPFHRLFLLLRDALAVAASNRITNRRARYRHVLCPRTTWSSSQRTNQVYSCSAEALSAPTLTSALCATRRVGYRPWREPYSTTHWRSLHCGKTGRRGRDRSGGSPCDACDLLGFHHRQFIGTLLAQNEVTHMALAST